MTEEFLIIKFNGQQFRPPVGLLVRSAQYPSERFPAVNEAQSGGISPWHAVSRYYTSFPVLRCECARRRFCLQVVLRSTAAAAARRSACGGPLGAAPPIWWPGSCLGRLLRSYRAGGAVVSPPGNPTLRVTSVGAPERRDASGAAY